MKHRNVDDLEPIAAKLLDQMDSDGPDVLDEGHGLIASYSIAASLKRLADAFERAEQAVKP